jgi:hypothetical protein
MIDQPVLEERNSSSNLKKEAEDAALQELLATLKLIEKESANLTPIQTLNRKHCVIWFVLMT